jgi:hypothetical protein
MFAAIWEAAMNKALMMTKWTAVADKNCIMSASTSPVSWHKIWLIVGMIIWGPVIIILEMLLSPFFMVKQSVRKNSV